MKYTCVIISDNPASTLSLKQYIEANSNLVLANNFKCIKEAIASINQNDKPDCIFVDISRPDLHIFCISLKIKELTRSLMYVSANQEHMKKANCDLPNFHSLPIQSDKSFDCLINKVKHEIKSATSDYFMAKLKKGIKQYAPCYYDSITYIEARKNYVDIITPKCTFTFYCSLKKVEELLKDREVFIRIHNSFIISTNAIETANNSHIKIKARKTPIPIGDHYRENLTNFLNQKSLQRKNQKKNTIE